MLFKITDTNAGVDKQVKHTEFKKFYPSINRATEWCTIEPFVQQAEDNEIIPAIGFAFYSVLETEYQTNGVIADPTKAYTFRLIRTALAHYAMYAALAQLSMRTGDAGTNETSSSDISPTRQWVFNVNRWETAKTAYKYMDLALQHMESQVVNGNVDYDIFKTSPEYTISKELLIPNAKTFQRYYNIMASRRSFTALRPYIKKAEEIYLKPILCEFLEELRTQHLDESLSLNNLVVFPMVQQLLAEYTVMSALPDLNFANDGDGWRVIENTYSTRPTEGSLSQTVQQMITRAEQNATTFEIQLKNELYANLDNYPTFRDGSCNELTQDTDGDGIADAEECGCDDIIEDGAVLL